MSFNQIQNDAKTHAAALEVAALVPSPSSSLVVDIPDANYTLKAEHVGKYLRFTNAGPVTFTIPTNATVPVPIRSTIEFEQTGLGTVTVVAGAGATVHSRGNVYATAGQYAVAMLKKTAADTMTLTGDLA